MPFPGWVFPLCRDVPQRQVDQLRGRLVAGEMPLVANRLADLAVQALNRVGRVQDLADLRREGEKRDHLLPAPAPTVHHGRVAFPVGAGFEPIQLCRSGLGRGRRVNDLQRLGQRFSFLPGGELQRVANEMDCSATSRVRRRVASFKNAPEFLSRCLTKMFLSRL